jgi:hypothetical protein
VSLELSRLLTSVEGRQAARTLIELPRRKPLHHPRAVPELRIDEQGVSGPAWAWRIVRPRAAHARPRIGEYRLRGVRAAPRAGASA